MATNVYADLDAPQAPVQAPSGQGPNVYAQLDGADSSSPSVPGTGQGTTWGGLTKNLGAGAEEGLTSLPGLVLNAINPVPHVKALLHPFSYPGSEESIGDLTAAGTPVTHAINNELGSLNPEKVPSHSAVERIARGVGAGASTGLIAGPETAIGSLMARAGAGAASGFGATAAEEIAPEPLKPLAGLAGGIVTGGGVATAARAIPAAGEAASSVIAPMRAAGSDAVAQRLAGQRIAGSASDLPAAKSALAAPGQEVVPGSEPTSFQQTGDMGLGALERETQTKFPELFRERQATQNAARVASLGNIQEGGDPSAVSSFLNNQFRAFEDNYDSDIAAKAELAQNKMEALGGRITPEAHGAALRGVLQDAEASARASEKGLWEAVDPDGDLTGNVTATRDKAAEIAASVRPTAKPMAGEEAGIFEAAQEMPKVAPVADLVALRSRVSTEMRNELIANGRSATYARLSLLRGAIQDNLGTTIGSQVEQESAKVASGELAAEDTTAARLEAWREAFYRQRQSATPGNIGQESMGPSAAPAAANGNGGGGTALSALQRPGGAPGDQGLPGNAPSFDEAAAERLKLATAATRERAGTFGRGSVADVLRKAGERDLYRLPEATVPAKFFHPGPTAFGDIQNLYKAIGQPRAVTLLADYAASSLRRAAVREDGSIDPVRFSRWKQSHADALRALPENVRSAFGSTQQAASALSNLMEARTVALRDMQAGAIGKLMKSDNPEDVTKAVAAVLRGPKSLGEFKALARQAAKDPNAMAGLRQAVADYISRNLISNTEVGTSGVNQIKADQFQTFLKQNRPHLAQIFSEQEMKNLDAIAADIKRSKRSEQAVKLPGQSNTAQDMQAIRRHIVGKSVLRVITDVGGAALGAHFGTMFGSPEVGSALGFMGGEAVTALREAGLRRVDEIVAKAMLTPAFAHELLKKVPVSGPAGQGLARALRRILANNTLLSIAQAQQRKPK